MSKGLDLSVVDIEARIQEMIPEGVLSSSEHFAIAMLDVFKKGFKGNARKKVVSGVSNHSPFDDGLLVKNAIHYLPKPPDVDATSILNKLQSNKETLKHKARYVLTFDGKTLFARDTVEGDSLVCKIENLIHEFMFFSALYGEQRYIAASENKADQEASIALSKIYTSLKQSNPDWALLHSHDVNTFMTRLLFCLFAEDTDLFQKDFFTKTIVERSGRHGENADTVIQSIFRILNTPDNHRVDEPKWLTDFPYVNGDVFALSDIHIPKFNIQAFQYLVEAGGTIDWGEVHADILGSAIQKITDPAKRHSLGMHYTSVTNIDKLLGPLFLDEIRGARVKANASGARRINNLHKLLNRISEIRIFDPACGSGNFLVIAYKRLREIEIQLLQDLMDAGEQQIGLFSQINLNNFYGIEYADFAAETAKVSLRIVEHQMDAVYGKQFNRPEVCLPLREAPNIHTGSAFSVDWNNVCAVSNDAEVYICGNPPYLGSGSRSDEQHAEQVALMEGRIAGGGRILDYVCNWFVCAREYCIDKQSSKYAFVATNSVTQGIHVPKLWPFLLSAGMEVGFAYPSFKWANLAGGNAGVTCVIIGMQHESDGLKRLFHDDGEVGLENINPYMIDAPDVWVDTSAKPISKMLPEMAYGNKPTDGGYLHLDALEKDELLNAYPQAEVLIRRLTGTQEILKSIERYCLWITEDLLPLANSIPPIVERINEVRKMRLKSKKPATRKAAAWSHRFDEFRYVDSGKTLVIPSVSSGERKHLPCSIFDDKAIANNSAFVINDAEIWHFALLTSTIHRCWLSTVGGRLEDRYRYSNTLVWNTFPMPEMSSEQKEALNKTGQAILDAQHYHMDLTLGDMYNPGNMGEELLAAHMENDKVIESLFSDKPFNSDQERLRHLFERYTEMTEEN